MHLFIRPDASGGPTAFVLSAKALPEGCTGSAIAATVLWV